MNRQLLHLLKPGAARRRRATSVALAVEQLEPRMLLAENPLLLPTVTFNVRIGETLQQLAWIGVACPMRPAALAPLPECGCAENADSLLR